MALSQSKRLMMRSRSTAKVLIIPAAICLALACAATPPSSEWKAPSPGSAPAGSPVALHGQLKVVTTPVAGTGTPAAGTGSQSLDAGDQGIDAGDEGIDGGNPAIDGGSPGIDAGKSGTDTASPAVLSQLVDQYGAPFQLKGVSSMWLEWESQPFAESKAGLQYMRDNWGLSVIRASMGTDQQGGYLSNQSIKSQVETIVQNAISLGVYVLVDWHTEQAVSQQAASVAFFTAMAIKYGAYPNVIWEPYNEPQGHAWSEIKTYHEAVVGAIRQVDPDNLIVLGTPQYSQRVDQAAADPVAGRAEAQPDLCRPGGRPKPGRGNWPCVRNRWRNCLRRSGCEAQGIPAPLYLSRGGGTNAKGPCCGSGRWQCRRYYGVCVVAVGVGSRHCAD